MVPKASMVIPTYISKIDGKWKQVHHHGSIDDPRLLAQYQSAVLRGHI